jgi:hypothetical protein
MKLLRTILAVGIVAWSLGATGPTAQAAQITGLLNISGTATFDTTSLDSATTVLSFTDVVTGGGNTGDFAGIGPLTPVAMASPYVFNPSTPTPLLWSVSGFTFSLQTSSVDFQDNTYLLISGTGTLFGPGFDPTPGEWAFTSQNPGALNHATFTFSAGTVAVPVPDGGMTVALLGAGLLGLALFRAKFANS